MQKKKPDSDLNLSAPIEIPEPWAKAFKESGMVSPVTGEPSIQALSRETATFRPGGKPMHPSAISRIISGRTREPHPSTISDIAKGLKVSPIEVAGWIGQKWSHHENWIPPVESHLMVTRERELVENMIRTLVNNRVKQDKDNED